MIDSRFTGVILDGCSTLFSFRSNLAGAEPVAAYLRRLGYRVTEEEVAREMDRGQSEFDCRIESAFARWARVCDRLGLRSIKTEQIGRLAAIEATALIGQTQPFPRMYETLIQLRVLGVKTGLCSNASVAVKFLEELFGLNELVDVFVVSCDLGSAKDEDTIFLEPANRLGLPTGRCLFVDDGPQHLERAKGLGYNTVLAVQGEVRHRIDPTQDYGQDYTITDLDQVIGILKGRLPDAQTHFRRASVASSA